MQEQEEAVKEAEKQRLDKEQKEREQRRKKEQEKEEQRRNATDRLEMIKKSEIGQKMLKDLDLDVSTLNLCLLFLGMFYSVTTYQREFEMPAGLVIQPNETIMLKTAVVHANCKTMSKIVFCVLSTYSKILKQNCSLRMP